MVKVNPFGFAPLHYLVAIEATVRLQFLVTCFWYALARLAQEPQHVACRMRTAPAQMTEEQLPFLCPKRQQRMIADLPIVGFGRALFVGRDLLIDTGVQINRAGGRLLVRPHALLQPQMDPLQVVDIANVELPQKLSRRRGRQNPLGVQQLLRAGVSAQHFQIAQMLSAQDQVIDQSLYGFAFLIAAFARFDVEFFVSQLLHSQAAGQSREATRSPHGSSTARTENRC